MRTSPVPPPREIREGPPLNAKGRPELRSGLYRKTTNDGRPYQTGHHQAAVCGMRTMELILTARAVQRNHYGAALRLAPPDGPYHVGVANSRSQSSALPDLVAACRVRARCGWRDHND